MTRIESVKGGVLLGTVCTPELAYLKLNLINCSINIYNTACFIQNTLK